MPEPVTRPRRILFVCMGNICRSPAAEAVARHFAAENGLEDRVEIDSAGTISYHEGNPPDRRMQATGAARGYTLGGLARQVTSEDLGTFDWIIAMDRENLSGLHELQSRNPSGAGTARLALLSEFLPEGSPVDVPDPYYGGSQGFERVLDLLEEGIPNLFEELLDGSDGS